jgi:hypothetical protein
MVLMVLRAFQSAGITDFRTKAAQLMRELRAAAHKGCGSPAGLGAVTIQPDTFHHAGNVIFGEARRRAVFTNLGAAHAGFDTGLVFVVGHFVSLRKKGNLLVTTAF